MLAHTPSYTWQPYGITDGRWVTGVELKIWLPAPLPLPLNTEARIDALMEHIDQAWGSEDAKVVV